MHKSARLRVWVCKRKFTCFFNTAAGTGGLKLVLSRCSGVKATPANNTPTLPPTRPRESKDPFMSRSGLSISWCPALLHLPKKQAGTERSFKHCSRLWRTRSQSVCMRVQNYYWIMSVCVLQVNVWSETFFPPTKRQHLQTSTSFKNTGSTGNQQQTDCSEETAYWRKICWIWQHFLRITNESFAKCYMPTENNRLYFLLSFDLNAHFTIKNIKIKYGKITKKSYCVQHTRAQKQSVVLCAFKTEVIW